MIPWKLALGVFVIFARFASNLLKFDVSKISIPPTIPSGDVDISFSF